MVNKYLLMMAATSVFLFSNAVYAITIKAQPNSGIAKTLYDQKVNEQNTFVAIDGCALNRKGKLLFTLDKNDPVGVVVRIKEQVNEVFKPSFFVLKGTNTQTVNVTTWRCGDTNVSIYVSGIENPRINERGRIVPSQ